jgi:uncharacterized protein YbbC (DUF1343 family)
VDIDAVLFDIPDVDARFYTYTWTLTYLIDACADAGVPLYVLDRPNPLGGTLESVEGPLLEPGYYSFIGRLSIPIRHSLTLGELAKLWRNERCPDADVRVITCDGWRRELQWPRTGLRFVQTSPAIASFEAALFYPGLCLFEATNVSVARGTSWSFRAVGAPWLDAAAIVDRFATRSLPGVVAEVSAFTPTAGPHAGESCRGVILSARDAEALRPVVAALALLADILSMHRSDFSWARYPTAANPSGADHFERVVGSGDVRRVIERVPEAATSEVLARLTAAPGWAQRWRSVTVYT